MPVYRSLPAVAWLLLQYILRMAFAFIAMRFLLVHVSVSLLAALPEWNAVQCGFVFLIQFAILYTLYELREYFIKDASRLLRELPKRLLRGTIVLANLVSFAGMVPNLYLVFSFVHDTSFVCVAEAIVLCAFVWVSAGFAVPLGAGRYWKWVRRYYS
ncbi:MAG: hypothetical protein V4539_23735 [Bacteroidota bacterium]